MTKRNEFESMTALSETEEVLVALDPIEREAYEWITRFMSGTMTSAEVDAMKVWYGQSGAHAAAYAKARRVWNALGPVARARMGERADVGHADVPLSRAVGRRAVLGGALAAAAAYAFVSPPLDLWPSYADLTADHRTGAGEQRQVTLADAVSLDLNTRTSLAVRSQTADATQLELISGEAAISTGPGSVPLTVIAASGQVVATRAAFNVRCDGAFVSIACLEGSLTVEREGVGTPLGPRRQVSYDGRGIGAVTAIDPDAVTAWRQGMLIFEATPVAQVIAEVNRYRSSRIVLMNADIGQRLLSARLRTTETDKIITQIVHIFGATARTLPGGLIVVT